MIKKFLKASTIVCLMFGLLSTTAFSSEGECIRNFEKINEYVDGQFADVSNEWYADAVKEVYELDLMKGTEEQLFSPGGRLTNAEAVAVASRLHSIYYNGENAFPQSEPWYTAYLEYAIENGICSDNFDPNQVATRAFFVGVIGNAVDTSILTEKNNIADGFLYDVNGWYADAVYLFYRSGVLTGNDAYGTFAPDSSVTRAEVAAIIVRIVNPEQRVSFDLMKKPVEGNYSILEDGSFEAYRQKALVANFQVILEGKEKTDVWQYDTYTLEHPAIPSSKIVIPEDKYYKEIDTDDDIYWIPTEYAAQFGWDRDMSYPFYESWLKWGYFLGPNEKRYSARLSRGDFGDLILEYPGEAAWSETFTYDSFYDEAWAKINATDPQGQLPVIRKADLITFVNSYFPDCTDENTETERENFDPYKPDPDYMIRVNYLKEWDGNYFFRTNYPDQSPLKPIPDLKETPNSDFYLDYNMAEPFRQWCQEHLGQCVLAVHHKEKGLVMLAEVRNYISPNQYFSPDFIDLSHIAGWDFHQGAFSIDWAYPGIEYANAITVRDENVTDSLASMYEEKLKNEDYGIYSVYGGQIAEILLRISDYQNPLTYEGLLENAVIGNLNPENFYLMSYDKHTYCLVAFTPKWNKFGSPEETGLDPMDAENTTLSFYATSSLEPYLKIKEWGEDGKPVYETIVVLKIGGDSTQGQGAEYFLGYGTDGDEIDKQPSSEAEADQLLSASQLQSRGITISYDPGNSSYILQVGDVIAICQTNSSVITVNGVENELSHPVQVIDGNARFPEEILNYLE